MWNLENGTDEQQILISAEQEQRHTDAENRHAYTAREGEGGTN